MTEAFFLSSSSILSNGLKLTERFLKFIMWFGLMELWDLGGVWGLDRFLVDFGFAVLACAGPSALGSMINLLPRPAAQAGM
jgi:hypothetical protein